MSAEDLTRTLLFCQLLIASTVNNFLSEKMISLGSVPAFNLLRRIFTQANLFIFLEVCEVLKSLHFERRHLQIGFKNASDHLLTDIYVTGHCPHGSFGIALASEKIVVFHLENDLWYFEVL